MEVGVVELDVALPDLEDRQLRVGTRSTCRTNARWLANGSAAQMSSSSVHPPARSRLATPDSTARTGGANSTAASGDQPFGHASVACACAAVAPTAQDVTAMAADAHARFQNPAMSSSRPLENPCRTVPPASTS